MLIRSAGPLTMRDLPGCVPASDRVLEFSLALDVGPGMQAAFILGGLAMLVLTAAAWLILRLVRRVARSGVSDAAPGVWPT